MGPQTFDNILLLARPASGKSELIDFLKKTPDSERANKYHIGSIKEMDDFPWIWQKFMEDNIWEAAGYERRYSFGGDNPGMSKQGEPLLGFCIQKFNVEHEKFQKENRDFFKTGTLFLEFARGNEKAFEKPLNQLSPEILKNSVILFVLVSYKESCRRNEARYQEKLQHSILAHKVPDETMKLFYQTHDWLELTENKTCGYLEIQKTKVPFVTVDNEIEPITREDYAKRYGPALRNLMELKNARV